MKKLAMVFLFALVARVSFGQNEYKKIFLGDDASAYKSLYLKLKSGIGMLGSYQFYSDPPKKNYQAPVYGRSRQYNFVTDTSYLVNREFLVTDVKELEFSSSYDKKYLFELKDEKETIYYVYEGKYDFNFPFLVKGFVPSVDYFEKFITKKSDDFTGSITYRTPSLKDVMITKIVEKNSADYYLYLETRGSTYNLGEKGVIVLFKDGTRWSRPEVKIDPEVIKGSGWGYTAFMKLSEDDLKLFSEKEIDKFRLYIYDNNAPDDSDRIPYYTQAIARKK